MISLENFLDHEHDLKVKDDDLITFTYSLKDHFTPTLDFLFSLDKVFPQIYWHSKYRTYEVFSFGLVRETKNQLDLIKLEHQLDLNEKLLIIGATQFEAHQSQSEQWSGFHPTHFIVPKLSFIKNENDHGEIRINIEAKTFHQKSLKRVLIDQISNILTPNAPKRAFKSSPHKAIKNPEQHRWVKSINQCLERIKNNELEKIVMARSIQVEYRETLDPAALFLELTQSHYHSQRFYFACGPGKTFMSFSPEGLFILRENRIRIDIIAGTRKRSTNPEQDLLLERELKESKKELGEHRVVGHYVKEQLEKIAYNIKTIKKEEILKLKYVQHLYGLIEAKLRENCFIVDLLNLLHPTPAVGGFPKEKVLPTLQQYEDIERGLYAGTFGLISKNYSEFGVSIRSSLVLDNKQIIFAGCGIVEESDPQAEWEETAEKMKGLMPAHLFEEMVYNNNEKLSPPITH